MKRLYKTILFIASLLAIVYVLHVRGLLQSFVQTLTGLNWVFEIDPFSALAFIIAMLSLYFSTIRGAHIDLEEIPEFKLVDKEYAKASQADFLSSLELQKTHFLLFNSGNRAGIIKNIIITFQPMASFKQFCSKPLEKCYVYDMIIAAKESEPSRKLPQVLEDKGSLKVETSYHFISLDKIYASLISTVSTINESDSLLSVLEKIRIENRKKVEDFVNFLSNTRELGTFRVEITCSYHGWLRSGKPKIISVKLVNNYKEFLQSLRTVTVEWDKFAPTFGEIVHIIMTDLENLIQPIENNIQNLEKPRASRDTLFPRLHEWSSDLLGKRSYPLLAKWKPKFIEELRTLSKEHLSFSERLDKTLELPKEVDVTAKIEEIEETRKTLKIKTEKAKQGIVTLKDNLLKEAVLRNLFE